MTATDKAETTKTKQPFVLFRPADLILAIGLILCGFALSFFLSFGSDQGEQVKVSVAGKPYGIYSLMEDQEVVIREEGSNTFRIEEGKVKMIDADCHGRDCVHEGEISRTGETIVCLANKVIIEVIGGEGDFDAISK